MNKSILQSKTFWLNIIALLSTAVPQIGSWLQSNPEGFLAALGAANVLMRFFTSGRVSLFVDSAAGGSGGTDKAVSCLLPWFPLVATAGAVGLLLPSCAGPGQTTIPITSKVRTDYGTIGYSSKSGISLDVDARSGK